MSSNKIIKITVPAKKYALICNQCGEKCPHVSALYDHMKRQHSGVLPARVPAIRPILAELARRKGLPQ